MARTVGQIYDTSENKKERFVHWVVSTICKVLNINTHKDADVTLNVCASDLRLSQCQWGHFGNQYLVEDRIFIVKHKELTVVELTNILLFVPVNFSVACR